MRRANTFVGFILLICALPFAEAQDINGNIVGTVHDPSGSVVPRVSLKALNIGTEASFEAVTAEDGSYTVRNLPPGVYTLVVEAPGFKRFEARNIRVQVNEASRVDVALTVGAAADTVTVSTEAVNVDTTTSTLKAVVDQKRIEELPLNGRNPTQLMRLIVGVTSDPRADVTSGTTYPGVTGVSVNGNRSNTTNYILDGGQNNDHYTNAPNPMPNPDALQEFSVQTNNFSAEFGRQSGGVVNAVTKSGTNALHGSAFEFVRNNALNAANYFSPIVNGAKKDDGLKRNQYGATMGGPVWIPKLYNGRDKTFFFFSYQGTIQKQTPNVVQLIVPSAAQRNGDFSSLSKALKNPAGGTYAGNQIPAVEINPISRALLAFIPLPNPGTNTISTAAPNNFNDDQYLARIDHQLTPGNRLSGRYWDSSAATPGFFNPSNYLEQTVGRTWLNRSAQLTDSHVFGPTVTNQALFSFNRTNGLNTPIYPPKSFADLGIKLYNDKMPQYYINIAGYFNTLNTGDTNQFLRDEYQASDTVRWTHGKHQLSFGGEYGRGIGDVNNNFRVNGRYDFNASAPFTGDAFADFLTGHFNSLTQGQGEYRNTRFNRVGVFAQDSWKVSRRLTLDLGLRWEPFFPFTDLNGKVAAWHPGQQSTRYLNAPLGVVFAGDPGVPAGGFGTVWSNIAPRVGFAYDVFGDGKTAIRGGYGIFFDQPNTIAANNQADQAPFGTVVTVFGNSVNSLTDPYAGTVNPFPGSLNPGKDVVFYPFTSQFLFTGDMRNSYVQSWNFTVEREVIGGFIFRGSYAGSKGTHLTVVRELNPAVYTPGATTATTNQRRIFSPGLGSSSLVEPVGNSTFHALQLTGEKRFSRGFSVLANYQFSKALDDSSNTKETGQSRTNPYDQRFDHGLADFDRRHVFNFSGLWELPMHFRNRSVNALAGGWALNAIASLYSGYPFTVLSGVDNARTGTGNQRADLIGNPNLPGDRTRAQQAAQWLNPAAFAPNAPGTYGNLGRNTFTGPGFSSVDLGLSKRFALNERFNAILRFEAFNAFNRVNLAVPTTSQNSGNFLRITSAYDPRILQIALRLTW